MRTRDLALCVTLVLVGLGAWAETPEAAASRPIEVREVSTEFVLELGELLDSAEVSGQTRTIDFTEERLDRTLPTGWSVVDPKTGSRWTKSRNAVVDVSLVRTGPLKLRIDVAAPVPQIPDPGYAEFPEQTVEVRWNGMLVGSLAVGAERQWIETTIPESAQRAGPNRIELWPRYWYTPSAMGYTGTNSLRDMGIQFWALELQSDAGTSTDSSALAERSETGFTQSAESVVTFYVFVPDGATFSASGVLAPATGTQAAQGIVQVWLTDSRGTQELLHVVSASELSSRGQSAVEHDLSARAGEAIALSFVYTVEPSAVADARGLPKLGWNSPRVVGSRTGLAVDGRVGPAVRPNILIVLFDTLRADHVEPYGGGPVHTPNLAEFAAQGVTFLNARAHSSWTRASVASLLTGLNPETHQTLERTSKLPDGLPFLPEILRNLGYRTCAILNNGIIEPQFGFGRGWDHVHPYYRVRTMIQQKYPGPKDQVDYVWSEYIEPEIRHHEENPGTPFFVYLHEIDPHAPYEAPEPYRSAYDTGYRGRADSEKTAVFLQKRHYQELSWPDIEHLKAMYRAEVAFMDDYFGYLMDRLRDRGVLENTLVVFLSDHGEEFYEHGNIGHDFALYEESIRVPLMMYFAGILPAGRTADAAVGLVDVMPTILDLAGSATPGEIDGLSLVPEIFAPKDFPKRPERIIAQKLGRHHLSAIAVGDWKLIEQPRGKPSEPGREFALFQLSRDPGERSDRFPSEEILGKTLAQVMAVGRDRGLRSLLQFSGSVSGQPEVNLDGLDDELIENLKALGYVN